MKSGASIMANGETNLQSGGSNELPARGRRVKPSKGMHPFLKSILIIGIILLLCSGAYLAYLWMQLDDTLNDISGNEPAVPIPDEQKANQKPMVILLLGLDTRQETRSLNTDVIMAIALNPQSKQATLVSLPRDLYMKPTGYKAQKANAFYSISRRYGEDKPGGPDGLVKRMFGEFLDVPIDYLTVINFKTFEDIIDELGGIEVDVDMDMCYIDNADGTEIRLSKGFQELNGEEALGFVRYRHSTKKCGADRTAESSDFERNERQQKVLSAMLDKMTSLGGLLKIDDVFKAVGDNVETDIPKSQLKSFLTTYAMIKKEDVKFVSLQGEWKSPYIRVEDEVLDQAKQELKNRLSGDSTPPAGTP